ncbi:hypothetical protein QFZ64_006326 [Streptomyces sp. B3I8]|nr:hypothetical protein [Streptomyces sp. B3I8]
MRPGAAAYRNTPHVQFCSVCRSALGPRVWDMAWTMPRKALPKAMPARFSDPATGKKRPPADYALTRLLPRRRRGGDLPPRARPHQRGAAAARHPVQRDRPHEAHRPAQVRDLPGARAFPGDRPRPRPARSHPRRRRGVAGTRGGTPAQCRLTGGPFRRGTALGRSVESHGDRSGQEPTSCVLCPVALRSVLFCSLPHFEHVGRPAGAGVDGPRRGPVDRCPREPGPFDVRMRWSRRRAHRIGGVQCSHLWSRTQGSLAHSRPRPRTSPAETAARAMSTTA